MARNLYELQGRADKRLSPFCWRTRMALWHKGLEAEFIPVQFGQKVTHELHSVHGDLLDLLFRHPEGDSPLQG